MLNGGRCRHRPSPPRSFAFNNKVYDNEGERVVPNAIIVHSSVAVKKMFVK